MRLLRTSRAGQLAVLFAVTALTMLFIPSASAGGPTSVLIASPERAETASLYYSDAEYEALSQQLGAQEPTSAETGREEPGRPPEGPAKRPSSLDPAEDARQINVTWMAHDTWPWRWDRVYPGSDTSTVWIHTSINATEPETGVWHRAKQPAALRALLTGIGVMGEKKDSGSGAASPSPSAKEWTRVPERRTAAAASGGGGDGRWWAIPALGTGVVLGLVLRPLAGRLPRPLSGQGGRRAGPGGRRQLPDT
ncbi:hypothetical protein OG875_10795 [Streptomyces sp. NBC_01498]|uniref:hypothetical protein n=1 Tax=Streptomyces sp. NBC_01498 TaxID=2975870 RepID=UPI002E7C12EE|nr:hypothetical protein [Streptomyces sp. NBC_01498]WTL25041.1 hypothetical protein OG875_10795 [Streptomyces sp. NBC_01498]